MQTNADKCRHTNALSNCQITHRELPVAPGAEQNKNKSFGLKIDYLPMSRSKTLLAMVVAALWTCLARERVPQNLDMKSPVVITDQLH